jgi:hypothetical protein
MRVAAKAIDATRKVTRIPSDTRPTMRLRLPEASKNTGDFNVGSSSVGADGFAPAALSSKLAANGQVLPMRPEPRPHGIIGLHRAGKSGAYQSSRR